MGVFAAISAALSWTIACFIWRSQTKFFSSIQINLIKNTLAAFLFSPVILTISSNTEIKAIAILSMSGFIGITLGDSFYITALRILGTRRTLTVEAFSPILANLFGAILIKEIAPLKVWIGASIITLSLTLIARENIENIPINTKEDDSLIKGFIFAFLSLICAVLAATLSRYVLKDSVISSLQSTEIRLVASIIFLIPVARINFSYLLNDITKRNQLKLVVATLLGTNLGIYLQQTVFKLLPIGLGWTLLSISPVISLFFASLEGEDIDTKSILTSLLALVGVAIALI